MKMTPLSLGRTWPLATILLTGASLQSLVVAQPVMAQDAPPAVPNAVPVRPPWVRIRNVSPRLIAWWLDPTHNAEPLQFQNSRRNAQGVIPSTLIKHDLAKPLQNFKLPEGVQRLVPMEPQNALLVMGTEAGVAELQKTIDTLDKPLAQVEIEVMYVEIDVADMKQLGIVAVPDNTDSGPLKRGLVNANINQQIQELVKQKKAKVVTAPRVTAINNLVADLRSFTTIPTPLEVEEGGKRYGVLDSNLENTEIPLSLGVGIGIGLTTVPTINDDETIRLLLAPGRVLSIKGPEGEDTGWRRAIDGVQTINNIKDGETVALTGGDSRLVGWLKRKNDKPSNLLLLVTPRIVRRAG